MYSLEVNFDSRVYGYGASSTTLSYGILGANSTGTFLPLGVTVVTAVSAATQGLRYKDDVIVGTLTVANVQKSFIAARKFVTNASELTGDLNIAGLNIGTITDSTIFNGSWVNNGTTLRICTGNAVASVANCPVGNTILNYALTFSGADITAFDSVNNDTSVIRVAKMGTQQIYLRSGLAGTSTDKRFRVGLTPSTPNLSTVTYPWGVSNSAPLTSSITDTSYSSTSGTTFAVTATTVSSLIAPGYRSGSNTSTNPANATGSGFFVYQGPIGVMLGARNATGLVGRMELSIQ
jgi:hypothetical protein